ncbi:hypothetical protein QFZ63_000042 [Streptomyces sp. B3I7]|nr:hypothetical protein [Streptomyces sp. B3I7]
MALPAIEQILNRKTAATQTSQAAQDRMNRLRRANTMPGHVGR